MSLHDTDSRLSTAAQFFLEDNEELATSYNKIVEWLNQAALSTDSTKTDCLRKVQEVIINKDVSLLDNFLDEVLGFQVDRNADVRKLIVGFIEEAVKKDPELLPKVIANLSMLLQDTSTQVQKRVIQAVTHVYRAALVWLSNVKHVTDEMEAVWNMLAEMKGHIVKFIDNDNDGIRTHSVKFLETLVLLQTYPNADSMKRENDFSLEDIPLTLKIARRRKLEEEANMVFELLLKFHGSPHISSVNLMTCMGSLTVIAKMRPQFMGRVVAALETLHANLPPTLSKSQVSSVRKHLKLQLLSLLKHPASVDYHTNITTLLTDLGATYQEVLRSLPRPEEMRKRQKRLAAESAAVLEPQSLLGSASKRARIEDTREDIEQVDAAPAPQERKKKTDLAIDITEQFISERLTPDVATQLVISSMAKLPDVMPPHFSSMYTPIAAAGTELQIRHVARLMATQITGAGIGPGVRQAKKIAISKASITLDDDEEEEEEDIGPQHISVVNLAEIMDKDKDKEIQVIKGHTLLPSGAPSRPTKHRLKTLKLSEITRPMDTETTNRMMNLAVDRILKAERNAVMGGVPSVRSKVIATLGTAFCKQVKDIILQYLLEDLRQHIDLALSWLYEEYSFMQGFTRFPTFLKQELEQGETYNSLICTFASSLIEKCDARDRDLYLNRLYFEAPLLTEDAIELLKGVCGDESKFAVGLSLLQELVTRRPPKQLVFVNALLEYTAHENSEVRSRAIKSVIELYDRGDLRSIIEEYAVFYMSFLRLSQPPEILFGSDRGRTTKIDTWNEDIVKACLYLYLALLPINEKLIHELAKVYVQTIADVKRIILRLLEQPVRGMGMDSPQLLTLVEECPKGAETLVTRIIHILTDKAPPSAELVAKVRDLYHTRVSDVRFLIPVLNGLSKKEVIAALPKLIKLNPVVVKEVFNKLLGTHTESQSHTGPVTPAELLIALHNIDPSKCELKAVMKATSLCFGEKQLYTQEVLAVVMQHLMEQNPLPTLLMRTVIMSLSMYPRLIGFVMNILQRLILKQVWKQKKVWEGFIKCCERSKPQSFQVLLQLPPPQLQDVFSNSTDLQKPLLDHVMSFTENQRAHIPKSIMDVLAGNRRSSVEESEDSADLKSPTDLMIDVKEESDDSKNAEPAPPGIE